MQIFLWYSLVCYILGFIIRLSFLAVGDYPRQSTHKSGEDAIGVVVNMAFAAWVIWLLTASS